MTASAAPLPPGYGGEAVGRIDVPVQERFRLRSNQAAKAVGIVSARVGSHDVATTVTDYVTVSWDPPTMLVSLYSLGRAAEAVAESDTWALSILAADQAPVAAWLAEPGTPTLGLLSNVAHARVSPGGPALIAGALAWFEIHTSTTVTVATHTLFAGEVVWFGGPDDRRPGAGERAFDPVLVRHRGAYRSL